VKGFYSGVSAPGAAPPEAFGAPESLTPRSDARVLSASAAPAGTGAAPVATALCSARIAVYDGAGAAPRVEDVVASTIPEFIEQFSARIYSLAREAGGTIPYTVIREIAENLVHADFREPVASVLDAGRTIRFTDQGPGIPDKERALLPGFTTASGDAKRFIRGVGSGLPIVQDYIRFNGGSLRIDDNLGSGTVVTIQSGDGPQTAASLRGAASMRQAIAPVGASSTSVGGFPLWSEGAASPDALAPEPFPGPTLTRRQKQVLALVAESGGAGPSVVARDLMVGVSTAYRDLASLEERDLVVSDDAGRRTVTEQGLRALETFMAG
jgi:hypothetical protein